ncbi:MAG: FG-GAP-like repeat-containing protein [Polyangiaceae bacterium]
MRVGGRDGAGIVGARRIVVCTTLVAYVAGLGLLSCGGSGAGDLRGDGATNTGGGSSSWSTGASTATGSSGPSVTATADAAADTSNNGSLAIANPADAASGPSAMAMTDAAPDASNNGSPARANAADAGDAPSEAPDGGTDASLLESGAMVTSYLMNPAHTSSATGATLTPPLARQWTAALPGPVSYPLVAGGLVYVIAGPTYDASEAGLIVSTSLVALDAQSGSTVWSAALAPGDAAHAYDGGRIFVVDISNSVSAFDAATGAPLWNHSMAGANTRSAGLALTAYEGVVYASSGGTGGALFAFDETTGQTLFDVYDPEIGFGSPIAVDDDGVVVAFGCNQTYKYDRLTGALLWHHSTSCSGGGTEVSILVGDDVYVMQPGETGADANVELLGGDGGAIGSFTAFEPPAFDAEFGLFATASELSAVHLASGQTWWTHFQAAPATFAAPPLLANGYVYALDFGGTLASYAERTGALVWTDPATPGEGIALAASGNLLLVPERSTLVAYRSAGDGGTGQGALTADASACQWTLQASPALAVGDAPTSMAIGDLNGDGHKDITVANFGGLYDTLPYPAGTLSVLLGNGDGSFLPQVTYPAPVGTESVSIADLNRDGKLDVAVLGVGPDPVGAMISPGSVGVLLGNGDGTLAAGASTATSIDPDTLAIADLNGDGAPDLVVANDALPMLSILLGNGDGTFQAAQSFGMMSPAPFATVGDVNADGKPDIVVVSADVEVLLGNGDGTFGSPSPAPAFVDPSGLAWQPSTAAMADLNMDGHVDLAVADSVPQNGLVFLGNGDGTFRSPRPFTTGQIEEDILVADMNGDGWPDMVVGDGSAPGVSVLLGNGDGTFQAATFFALAGGSSLAVGDLNGDGLPDVASSGGTSSIQLLLSTCQR